MTPDEKIAAWDALEAESAKALHASAPAGMKCSDCMIDKSPCPDCYAANWKRQHPNTHCVGGVLDAQERANKAESELGRWKKWAAHLCENDHTPGDDARTRILGALEDGTRAKRELAALAAEAKALPRAEDALDGRYECIRQGRASGASWRKAALYVIRQRDEIAARAAVLAELRERALREALENALTALRLPENGVLHCRTCPAGMDNGWVHLAWCSINLLAGQVEAARALARAALAAPSGPGVLAQVVEALCMAAPHHQGGHSKVGEAIRVALRTLGEDVP